MYSISVDESKNLLIIKFSGYSDGEEILEFIEAFSAALIRMKTGFVLINDISEFSQPMDDIYLLIKEAIEVVDSYNPEKVIRVVDLDNPEALLHFEKGFTEALKNYEVLQVKSIEEAMKLV